MGLGINWAGAAAGYQGFKEEQRRTDEDARRAAADAKALKDQAYQEETRDRQRYEWRETDRKRDESKGFDDEYRAKYRMQGDPVEPVHDTAAPDVATTAPADVMPSGEGVTTESVADPAAGISTLPVDGAATAPSAPSAPSTPPAAAAMPSAAGALAAPAIAKAAGMPQPRPMGNILDMFANRLNSAAQRGDTSMQEYAATRDFLTKARNEGVTQAVTAWNRGDYAGGMALFNGMGQYNGATIVGTPIDTTTKLPNGQVVPTHIVTIQNADKTRAVINTALDEYKLQSLADRVKQEHDGAVLAETAKYHDGTIKIQQKNADTNEQWRKDQAKIQAEANRVRQEIGTAKGAGNGAKLDAKAAEAEVERNPHLYSVAQDDTGKDVPFAAAKSLYHNMLIRLGNSDKAYITMTQMKAEAIALATDPKTGAVNQAQFVSVFGAMVAQADQRMRASAIIAAPAATTPSGSRDANQTKSVTPPAKPPSTIPGSQSKSSQVTVDVRNDAVLSPINTALAKLDMNDPKNTAMIMKLGKARNERLTQLQQDNGKYTSLISQ